MTPEEEKALDYIEEEGGKNNMIIFAVVAAMCYGAFVGMEKGTKEISKLRVQNLRSASASDIPKLPEKLYSLVSMPQAIEDDGLIAQRSLNNTFSPIEYVATLPEVKTTYKAPPLPPKPKIQVSFTPSVDVKNIFKTLFKIEAITNNGVIMNSRFYALGKTVLDGKPDGEKVKVRVVLMSIEGREATFDVNGETVTLEMEKVKKS